LQEIKDLLPQHFLKTITRAQLMAHFLWLSAMITKIVALVLKTVVLCLMQRPSNATAKKVLH